MSISIVLFRQGLNTTCAKQLAHLLAVFVNRDPLEIGAEFTSGGDKRVAAIMPKVGGFSTIFAFCHLDFLSCCSIMSRSEWLAPLRQGLIISQQIN